MDLEEIRVVERHGSTCVRVEKANRVYCVGSLIQTRVDNSSLQISFSLGLERL